MRQRTFAILAIILALVGLWVWAEIRAVMLNIRIALAQEQTAIFEQMAERASDALSETPPDIGDAISSLEYTIQYYPSGSKQVAGSRLDRIVERARAVAMTRIIHRLKSVSGEDHGDNPQAWIDANSSDVSM